MVYVHMYVYSMDADERGVVLWRAPPNPPCLESEINSYISTAPNGRCASFLPINHLASAFHSINATLPPFVDRKSSRSSPVFSVPFP